MNYLHSMVLKWLNPLVLKLKLKPKMSTTNFQCKFSTFAKMQDKEKTLKKELTKSNNKYELTKI
jgi:hypothetical protein